MMKNWYPVFLIFILATAAGAHANDGAYMVSGNHLIPIFESEIEVRKEVLRIYRIDKNWVEVIVDYEFYNPLNDKKLLVGFEAPSPNGDVDGRPVNGGHPYIRDFTVTLNGENLPFMTAMVSQEGPYLKDGKVASLSSEEAKLAELEHDYNYPQFDWVYYFEAPFKNRQNFLRHTYRCHLSSSVDLLYDFSYILTAANRWANRQIDDFTLKIYFGPCSEIAISNTFFQHASDWRFNGKRMDVDHYGWPGMEKKTPHAVFYSVDDTLQFRQVNFRPKGELNISSGYHLWLWEETVFNHAKHELTFEPNYVESLTESTDELSYKILRNLPFARRGYVFRSPEIQAYYSRMPWYGKDTDYQPVMSQLTQKEQRWIQQLKAP